MQRYFIMHPLKEKKVNIIGEDVHHIIRVMRFKKGDKIICNDPEGNASICVITNITKDMVEAEAVEPLLENREMPVRVTIAQGLPKGDKLDLIIQKGTELGACGFIPVQMERSVVQWDAKKSAKKLARLQKIAKEASEQCHRNKIPEIYQMMNLKQLVETSEAFDVKLFAYEEEAKVNVYSSLGDILMHVNIEDKVLLCIGPEGGFSEKEVNELKESGFLPVRLGPRILRAETAPIYALSAISYHFEELHNKGVRSDG